MRPARVGRWAGQRDGAVGRRVGGAVDPDTVVRAVRLTGAAKYFWPAPLMLGRIGGTRQSYDARGEAEMFAGRRPVLDLLARWATAP